MAKKQDFLVVRGHEGDKWYEQGSIRTADPTIVAHLVPSTLKPVDEGDEEAVRQARLRSLFRDPVEGGKLIDEYREHSAGQRDEIERLTKELADRTEASAQLERELADSKNAAEQERQAHGVTRDELTGLKADPRLKNKAEQAPANKADGK